MTIQAERSSPPDLSSCDREPIQIPGSIQPHGYLFVVEEPSLKLVQASRNVAELLGRPVEQMLGTRLDELWGERLAGQIREGLKDPQLERRAACLQMVSFPQAAGVAFDAIGHRRDGVLILELEQQPPEGTFAFGRLHRRIESFIFRLAGVDSVPAMSELVAEETRAITGFDRVLVYRFDPDWNGLVIAQSRNDRLPSYLDLRFPASDIPKQARELYRINRVRLIADASYTPVPLQPATNPLTGRPTDLSLSVLRSVSPVHVEYMKNMGTACSMSVSILREGRLWGLIACHHHTPQTPSFDMRTACDFLGQIFGLQLATKEQASGNERRVELKSVLSRLLAAMAVADTFVDGLVSRQSDLLQLTDATGAAIVADGVCTLVGRTPSTEQVGRLTDWLAATVQDEVFSTETLSLHYPQAEAFKDLASGLLSISISKLHRSYILWFRPEVLQTVKWGGDPHKPAEVQSGSERLHPRQSFEMWKETVRLRSPAWQAPEIETAAEFRNVILGIVLRTAEELADLSKELEQSNKELEAFSYSVSHDLRAPFRHIVGYAELLREMKSEQLDSEGKRYIATIIESAAFAGTLVDNLLAFSQMGRSSLTPTPVQMNQLIAEVQQDVLSEVPDRRITWHVAPLPTVEADVIMLQLAVRNLLANAVKYSRDADPAVIEIGSVAGEKEIQFFVRDNGIGFDMKYVDKLFGVFQRLHRMEDFEGTGIGLANVRRIIARHGGRTWASGAVGKGATFFFTLPYQSAGPGDA